MHACAMTVSDTSRVGVRCFVPKGMEPDGCLHHSNLTLLVRLSMYSSQRLKIVQPELDFINILRYIGNATERGLSMASNWQELTNITGTRELTVERVRIRDSGVVIEGQFDLPPLARLTYEDQVFVATFVRAHGSIKDMESAFGVSYPTIKNRLARLSQALDFVR